MKTWRKIIEASRNEPSNYITKNVHISTIRAGDTVEHDGVVKTVSGKDIKQSEGMGTTLFGDSYNVGNKKVKKVEFLKESSKRNDFKITYADGNSITTGFNGTLEDAKKYYEGKSFNLGDGKGGDKMVKATKVEQLN